jgi:hypothetical protein
MRLKGLVDTGSESSISVRDPFQFMAFAAAMLPESGKINNPIGQGAYYRQYTLALLEQDRANNYSILHSIDQQDKP